MGTGFIPLITDWAMVEIDDIRLTQLMEISPALFFRKMSLYVNMAIPMFTRPVQFSQLVKQSISDAEFGDMTWISTPESTTEETQIDTGLIGFDLCSVSTLTAGKSGEMMLQPYTKATYDPETGMITFPTQEEEGIEYEIDCYKDGNFGFELTARQSRILALCIACVWDERFSRDWLNLQPKIQDTSFSTGSEATHMNAVTNKNRFSREMCFDEMRRYEQDCQYASAISGISPSPGWNLTLL